MKCCFHHVAIESISHVLPPAIISSDEIEARLKTLYERLHLRPGRLFLMTGIQERRAWDFSQLPSAASSEAGEKVLEISSLDRKDIDLLIHSSVCRDRLEPATAAYVHQQLRLTSNTQFFDLSNACLGFLNAMLVAASMIESNQIRSALIVSGENGKPLLDHTLDILTTQSDLDRQSIKPYFANLTIGSGAVAAILCHTSLADKIKLRYASVLSNSDACRLCQGDTAGNVLAMQTDSEQLLHAGLDLADQNWQQFKTISAWDSQSVDHTICHQVGQRHLTLLYQKLGLDIQKDYSTFKFLGNTGSVALPITLSHAKTMGVIQPRQKIALLGIGSGISSIMLGVES